MPAAVSAALRLWSRMSLDLPDKPLVYEELSKRIIGAAMEVLNSLKPGLDERLYENALVI